MLPRVLPHLVGHTAVRAAHSLPHLSGQVQAALDSTVVYQAAAVKTQLPIFPDPLKVHCQTHHQKEIVGAVRLIIPGLLQEQQWGIPAGLKHSPQKKLSGFPSSKREPMITLSALSPLEYLKMPT